MLNLLWKQPYALPNIDLTTLLNLNNLSFMAGDEELVHPAPPPPPHSQPYLAAFSSSIPSFS